MKVEYAPTAGKQFSRLNKPIQSRIKKYMSEIALLDNPRSRGKALTSNLSGLWRYRVGDYRIMSAFEIGAEPLSRKRTGHPLENKSYGIGEENLFCRGVFPPLNDGTEYKTTRRL